VKLTVVGATGGIGRLLCAQATAAGHTVTAVVRDPAARPAAATTVVVDLAADTGTALVTAVQGADAVLSALGPRSTADAGIVSRGTRALLAAMQTAGTARLVVVSAAPIGTVASPARPHPPRHDPGDGIIMRAVLSPVVKRVFAANYADLAEMEDQLRASPLDWTAVRPPRLTNGPRTGAYRTAVDRNLRRGLTISRADVADAMLGAAADPATAGHTLGLAR
jgi:putative NADH-flavin reductase